MSNQSCGLSHEMGLCQFEYMCSQIFMKLVKSNWMIWMSNSHWVNSNSFILEWKFRQNPKNRCIRLTEFEFIGTITGTMHGCPKYWQQDEGTRESAKGIRWELELTCYNLVLSCSLLHTNIAGLALSFIYSCGCLLSTAMSPIRVLHEFWCGYKWIELTQVEFGITVI
jgi:hypothetical protein